MRLTFTMLLVLVMSAGVCAQSKGVKTFPFEKKAGSHTARVVFRTKVFERARHRSTEVREGQTMVDGRPAIGTDGSIPAVEIDSMRFYFDGKEIKVPWKLYADCFNPNFGDEHVSLKFGRDGRSVMVTMSGSDGAGGYAVSWTLRKNGRHVRSIDQP